MADSLDFESLVARFYEPLYQFAFSLTRNEADACDLVATILLHLGEQGPPTARRIQSENLAVHHLAPRISWRAPERNPVPAR